jgi:hypothetical protein
MIFPNRDVARELPGAGPETLAALWALNAREPDPGLPYKALVQDDEIEMV